MPITMTNVKKKRQKRKTTAATTTTTTAATKVVFGDFSFPSDMISFALICASRFSGREVSASFYSGINKQGEKLLRSV